MLDELPPEGAGPVGDARTSRDFLASVLQPAA
jgi:hypothetical protein